MTIEELLKQIEERGVSEVLDELLYREELTRDEFLHWRQLRQTAQSLIPHSIIDELSQIAEDAFNNDNPTD